MNDRCRIFCFASMVLLLAFVCLKSQGAVVEGDTLVIVAFGNSTTAPRAGVEAVYPERLHRILVDRGVPNRIVNAGLGGSHTGSITDNARHQVAHGRDRLKEAVLAHQPKWVIIWFGINDAWVDAETTGQPRIPLADYKQNLIFFIQSIRQAGGDVVLLTPNPLGARYEPWRLNRLQRYRKATIRIARTYHTQLVDVWGLCTDYVRQHRATMDDLLLDGMHPNDSMHKLTAEAVADRLLTKIDND